MKDKITKKEVVNMYGRMIFLNFLVILGFAYMGLDSAMNEEWALLGLNIIVTISNIVEMIFTIKRYKKVSKEFQEREMIELY